MDSSYNFRKPKKTKSRWRRNAFIVFILIILATAFAFWQDVSRNKSKEQIGPAKISQLVVDKGSKIIITEPTFSVELPPDWKETNRFDSTNLKSITWTATIKNQDNRFLTIYIDKLPLDKAYNRLLPLEAVGDSLRHGSVSENCAGFTEGGSFNTAVASKSKETMAKWEDVSFKCDLPKVIDNVVGTSSKEGINTVSVTGKKAGTHKYFFLYTDHNHIENMDIFLEIIKSFRAL